MKEYNLKDATCNDIVVYEREVRAEIDATRKCVLQLKDQNTEYEKQIIELTGKKNDLQPHLRKAQYSLAKLKDTLSTLKDEYFIKRGI